MKTIINELSERQREIVMRILDGGFHLNKIPEKGLSPKEVYVECFSDIFNLCESDLDIMDEETFDYMLDLIIDGYDFGFLNQLARNLINSDAKDELNVYLNAATRLAPDTFMTLYEDGFDGLQIYTIAEGFESNVDVTPYITPEFDIDQIEQIETALIYDVDVNLVNDVNLSRDEMEEIISEAAFC